jgi:hydroxypyruvate reductase
MTTLKDQAQEIVTETLRRVNVRRVVQGLLACDGRELTLGGKTVPLAELDQIAMIAVGKAALPMYEAARDALPGVPQSAVIVTNQAAEVDGGVVMRGSHPLPDSASLQAAWTVLWLLKEVTERTAVLFLISGGASAMLEMPLDDRISVADTAAFYQALIGSGLPIAEMNALRKHFSAVKGGRLAEAAAAARMQYTMLISDVPAHLPDAIGSGPSLPDSTTLADCRALLPGLRLPLSVTEFFASSLCVETPKPRDAIFDRAHWDVVLSSDHLAGAASAAATAAGFHVEIDNACDEWEYRDAARYLIDRGIALAKQHRRLCLISVGEVGVTLPAEIGEGGRNQQFALWCALELARLGVSATVVSVGSDGIDGNSSAAGAVCDQTTPAQAQRLGLSVEDALAQFNTTPLLRAVGSAIETGPTGNNLRDLRMLLFG